MDTLTLNIYPQGHYHYIPPKRLYLAGQRIIRKFLERGLIKLGEYSLLVYTPDRTKIEIIKESLDITSAREILERERNECAITCYKESESDSQESLQNKCLATKLREELIDDKYPWELNEEEWKDKIGNVVKLFKKDEIKLLQPKLNINIRNYFEKVFLHFIMNPIGYAKENEICDKIKKELK